MITVFIMRRIIFIICFLSVLPLILFVFHPLHPHTSDGLMHLARIAAYYKEVVHGQFPVRWASDLNYGYGIPIFNFFHPLPYMITTVFIALGSSLSQAFRFSFLLGHILAGVFFFLFSYELTKDKKTAFLVTLFYQFAPFRLVDIVVRGSLGGIYSYALIPLLLWAITAYIKRGDRRFLFLISGAGALMALSHNITGFMFFGVSAILAVCMAPSWRVRLTVIGAMLWGVVMSAWFVFPAIWEHKYTYGYEFTKDLFYKHFPPLQSLLIPNLTNSAGLRVAEVSVQIGIFHIMALIAAAFMLARKSLPQAIRPILLGSLIISVAAILFMQPVTTPVWETVPFLRQFQYPWRILSALTFTTSVAAVSLAFFLRKTPKSIFILLIGSLIFTTAVYWKSPEGYENVDEAYWWNYPLTTNYYGEIDTVWAEGPAKTYAQKRLELIEHDVVINDISHKGIRHYYRVTAPKDGGMVRQNTYYFPGWSVTIDGVKTPIEFQSQHNRGIITFRVPPGTHDVVVAFTQSAPQRLGNAISFISITTTTFAYLILKKRRRT